MLASTQLSCANHSTFSAKLAQLNLEWIATKLMHCPQGEQWSSTQVTAAIAHYKQFLFLLYLYPDRCIVPTVEIDRVWHQHILNTSQYAQDCYWLFGYFVHHYPHEENDIGLLAACQNIPTVKRWRC